MKYLITLTISLIALYAFVKRTYNYASVNDEVDTPPIDVRGLKQGDVYKDKSGNKIMLTSHAPLDYEETQAYKESEYWFSGIR